MSVSSDLKLFSDMAYRLSLATKGIGNDTSSGESFTNICRIYTAGIRDCLNAIEAWFEVTLDPVSDRSTPLSSDDRKEEFVPGPGYAAWHAGSDYAFWHLGDLDTLLLPLQPEADSDWGLL